MSSSFPLIISECVLLAALFLLDKRSNLRPSERGSPIKVSRAISALVNSLDDHGVLVGKWQQPYDDGIEPWEWNGSVKILDQYLESGGKAVKYGQCWVFSAVTVSSEYLPGGAGLFVKSVKSTMK